MSDKPAVTFNEIKIGDLFVCKGKDYLKMSVTTARRGQKDRVFFFRQQEIVFPLSWW